MHTCPSIMFFFYGSFLPSWHVSFRVCSCWRLTGGAVQGASRGLGAEIAKDLAGAGCSVVVNYAASSGAAEEVGEKGQKKTE